MHTIVTGSEECIIYILRFFVSLQAVDPFLRYDSNTDNFMMRVDVRPRTRFKRACAGMRCSTIHRPEARTTATICRFRRRFIDRVKTRGGQER